MRAWRLTSAEVLRCEDIESQPVGENSVKIKIIECALSRNDKMVYDGKIPSELPIILGETCIGVVSEVGENVKRLARGNKVLAVPKNSCRECAACLSGKNADCPSPQTLGIDADGFLRNFAVLNASDLYILPDRISGDEALYVDYINIAIGAILSLNLEKGAHIAVVGATDIGIIFSQVALYYQMVPILIDTDQERLEIAESLGVYYTINISSTAAYKKILTTTGGKMADGLVYAVSSDMPFQQCFDYLKKGGVCAIVGDGYSDRGVMSDFSTLIKRGITVIGISGEIKNAAGAINMLANKSVSVQPLLNKTVGFEEANKLFESDVFDTLKDGKIIVKID